MRSQQHWFRVLNFWNLQGYDWWNGSCIVIILPYYWFVGRWSCWFYMGKFPDSGGSLSTYVDICMIPRTIMNQGLPSPYNLGHSTEAFLAACPYIPRSSPFPPEGPCNSIQWFQFDFVLSGASSSWWLRKSCAPQFWLPFFHFLPFLKSWERVNSYIVTSLWPRFGARIEH